MTADSLSYFLDVRPPFQELVEKGLVHAADANYADRLHAPRHDLNKNILRGTIQYHLQNRRTPTKIAETMPRIFQNPATPPPYNRRTVPFQIGGAFIPSTVSSGNCSSWRRKYALAFKLASRLTETRQITKEERGMLKELILDNNELIFCAIEVFEGDGDVPELLDTIYRIAKAASTD